MSLDLQLFEQLQYAQRLTPVLRFYCWNRPTVSLGTNQVADQVVISSEINRLGYGLVTRPTGGRALLHKGDLCYAIIARRDSHPDFRSLTTTYRAIGEAISSALKSIGIQITELPQSATPSRSALNPCFAMLNPFEVTVRGRKICGSAQFRSGEFFLQHGSIRVEDNWNDQDLSALWPAGFRLKRDSITSIEREMSNKPPIKQVVAKFENAFCSRFDLALTA
ncbi:MAG: biotin/lipoate A/B protein ligase family protein [Candidatus Zixiibacteriota bacterium]